MARIDGMPLDAKVVEAIAARDGLDEAAARERGLETLRLAAAHIAEAEQARSEHPQGIADARREHILRTARARLWLETEFEPNAQPEDIPRAVLDSNLDDPAQLSRHFHGKRHLVCNILVLPAAKGEDGRNLKPDLEDEAWTEKASAFMAEVRDRLREYDDDFRKEKNCDIAYQYLGMIDPPEDGELELRLETLVVENPETFVKEFTDQVLAVYGPQSTVEPFFTEYGLHFLYVLQIRESNLPSGEFPEAELRDKRREALSERMHPAWQEHHFKQTVENLRKKRVVRLAQDDGGDAGAGEGS